MATYKLTNKDKKQESLFNKWNELSQHHLWYILRCRSVLQNEMEVSSEQLNEDHKHFCDTVEDFLGQIFDLNAETMNFILNCKEEESNRKKEVSDETKKKIEEYINRLRCGQE